MARLLQVSAAAALLTLLLVACGSKQTPSPGSEPSARPASPTATPTRPRARADEATPTGAIEGTPTPTPFSGRLRPARGGPVAPAPTFAAPITPTPQKEWTVMVYMVADNNLEGFGLSDVREMAKVGSTDKVNVLVQIDRHPDFDNDPLLNIKNFTSTKRFYVKKDSLEELADLGEKDTADPAQLTDFLTWAPKNFPAKKYALVMWDHGGAWRGVGLDETSGTFLALPLLSKAMREARLPLALIAFDACLMSTVEVAYELTGLADTMVASEELEPGDGWDYTRVLTFFTQNPTADGAAAAKAIVDAYFALYQELDPAQVESLTMAAFDLKQMGSVPAMMKSFGEALQKEVASAKTDKEKALLLANLEAARIAAPGFGRVDPFDPGSLFDLGRLVQNFALLAEAPALKEAATNLAKEVEKARLYQKLGSSRQGSLGLTVFYPGGFRLSSALSENYQRNSFSQSSGWLTLLKQFSELRKTDTTPPQFVAVKANADSITPGKADLTVAGAVSDDFYVGEFDGLVLSQQQGELVVFEQAPFASLFLASAPFVLTFDGKEFTVSDAKGVRQYVGAFNFGALEQEGGIGGMGGVYTSQSIPEGLPSLLLFDMKSLKLTTIYDVSGSQAPVLVEPGATFTPHRYVYDPSTQAITAKPGTPVALDSLKIENRPLPPGDYQIVLRIDDFGGNKVSQSIPIKILPAAP